MNGANISSDPYRFPLVVMPLVRLLVHANLSWADREKIADAILACQRHYDGMIEEANMLANRGSEGHSQRTEK